LPLPIGTTQPPPTVATHIDLAVFILFRRESLFHAEDLERTTPISVEEKSAFTAACPTRRGTKAVQGMNVTKALTG
jgi:hypothetical protein